MSRKQGGHRATKQHTFSRWIQSLCQGAREIDPVDDQITEEMPAVTPEMIARWRSDHDQ